MKGHTGLWRGPTHSRRVLNRRRLLGSLSGLALGAGLHAKQALAQTSGEPAQGHLPVRSAAQDGLGPPALMELLACVPDSMMDEDYAAEYPWFFVDIEQQFRSRGLRQGVGPGDAPPDGYLEALSPMAVQNAAFDHVLDQKFTAAIGFQPLNVHTSLVVGGPSGRLTLLRGGMDLATMPPVWEVSGYERSSTADGYDVWTMGGELDFDFAHPIQGRVLGSFNNAAILDGDVVAFAPELTTIEQAIAVQRAGVGSIANVPELVQPAVPLPETTVSCLVVRKDILHAASFDGPSVGVWGTALEASDAEIGPMPLYVSIGLGISGGLGDTPDEEGSFVANDMSGGDARVMVTVATASAADAEQAGRVVSHRWNTGESAMTRQPYTDFMNVESVRVEGTVAMITFTVVAVPAFWKQMILSRDTYPFIHGSLPQ